ncbi:serine/threonine-protein kinase [Aureliella helgolandensis]|uniref:Serine/threonine-protein kinase PknB n=1 Tax=Aureliella helgolandensis TaxID=2527968 RepID=A0A518G3N5_9BACT|nr:serine/threonine-protein kinase [Aureliella helgolandensis]QDV23180.1 Serine/threonine-protein kinase PknB [Aureliella helgolandensis]
MTESAAELTCPRCGAAVGAAVASGICPTCLLKQAALGTADDSIPATPWRPPTVEEIASEFTQLEIMELIGHGGMGAVYKARQKSLGRLVALKILAPQHADNPDFAKRFSREGKILAEVNHSSIVTVHDFGRAGKFYFLLMEYVDGVNLRQAMTAGRLTPKQALAIVPPICEALQFAHDRGIVHRDIKPENLLLDKDGRIKIADFGIARMLRTGAGDMPLPESDDAALAVDAQAGTSSEEITREAVLGTPRYMAPEQRDEPAAVDHRADIYSLGVVLYEMLTGELPGATLQPPSRRVEIDVRLDEIVLRALDQNPEYRYRSATEFQHEVETVVSTPTDHPSQLNQSFARSVPRSTRCHVTTPQRLATFVGQLFLWRSHGRLTLDDRQLTITQGPRIYEIPLHSICDLSLGRYPMLVNPAGLNFIRFTYEVDGSTNCLIVSPTQGLIGLPSHFNDDVEDWFQHLQAATTAATGRPPVTTPTHEVWLARTSRWGLAVIPLFLLPILGVACLVWLIFEGPRTGTEAPSGTMGWTLSGILGVLALIGLLPVLLHLPFRSSFSSYTTATEQPDKTSDEARPSGALAQLFGLRSVWGLRFLMIAHLGFLGFLRNLPGLERAAGMYGFFGFIGVATLFEFRARYRHHPHLKVVSIIAALVLASPVAVFVGASILFEYQTPHATVITRNPTVHQGHFSFHHEVDCPDGWNVWLTLECVQLRMNRPEDNTPWEPNLVKRYQAKLQGKGRMRIPLDYLPSTDEARNIMLATLGQADGYASDLSPNYNVSLLTYTTESLMRVWAILQILPEGESPDSLLDTQASETVRFVMIVPPARPTLGPFEGAYSLGKVELVAMCLQGSSAQPLWKANGEPCTDELIPERGGSSSAAGKVIKEIAIRVRSETNLASKPRLRFAPEARIAAMGGSFFPPDTKREHAMLIQTIACPPEALETNVEVGIADGDWKTRLTFARHPRQHHFSGSQSGGPDGLWEGVVRTTESSGDSVPLAFSFSNRDDHETRLVYEKTDGTIVPLKGDGTDGGHGLTNSLTTLRVDEFESIEEFHVQCRRYEWLEFKNVSLQLGHRTNVEVYSTY